MTDISPADLYTAVQAERWLVFTFPHGSPEGISPDVMGGIILKAPDGAAMACYFTALELQTLKGTLAAMPDARSVN